MSGLQLQQFLRIDGDRVGIDRSRSRNRAGDDFALRQQAFDAGIDQPLAKLVEIDDAADKDDERDEIEEQDAARQARKDRIAEDAANEREGMRPAPSA